MFCKSCGQKIEDDSKFCFNCGMSINEKESKREIVYEGNIHKCPNCGEILNSFTIKCPSCGVEIRDRNSSNSLREFCLRLERIESEREEKDAKRVAFSGDYLTKTDEQKISLIRSFIIPNTKEDLYEFLVLAKSNIEIGQVNTVRLAVSNAWKAKFEQAYQKAKLLFINDERMSEIQALYDELKNEQRKSWIIVGIIVSIIIGLPFLFIVLMAICL